MKKNLLFVLGLILTTTMNAQYLNETFDTAIPATWQNIDNASGGLWEWESGAGAVAIFNSDGYGNDSQAEDADLITNTIDCSTAATVHLSFKSGFRQYTASVGRLMVSNDDGATWSAPVFQVSASGIEDVFIDISALAANSATVKLKFNYVGDYDYWWWIDNVTVYTADAKDINLMSIDNSQYGENNNAINLTGTLQNQGSETITSFDLEYAVDGGTPVSANITGVNIPFGGSYTYTHPIAWTPTVAGAKSVVVTSGNINGAADANMANNSQTKSFTIFDAAVQRIPLFEVFTSSTCGPCKPGNENFHGIVNPKPSTDYVSIKYQQDFPGSGDPYTTTETLARRNYYGINSIPRMELDGGWDQNAASFSEALYTERRVVPAFINLSASYSVDQATHEVKVKVIGLPVQDFAAADYRLQVAIIENKTTQNVKSNGETEFLQVAKKMMPDQNGTAIASFTNMQNFTYELAYTFNGSFRLPATGSTANIIDLATEHSVEEFDDLRVVVWLQNHTTKDVLQAFNAVEATDANNDGVPDAAEGTDTDGDGYSDWSEIEAGLNPIVADEDSTVAIKNVNVIAFNVYPNPTTDVINVKIETKNNASTSVELVDVLGRIVDTKIVKNNFTSFNVSKLNAGVYLVNVISEGNSIATTTVIVK